MMLLPLLVAVQMIEVHGADDQVTYFNVKEISSLRAPTGKDMAKYFAPGVHCVIVTTNAKFLAVKETCAELHALVTKEKP